MNVKWMHSLRWRLLFYSLASAGMTAAALYAANFLVALLLQSALRAPFAFVIHTVGSLPVFIAAGIALYVSAFFLLSHGTIRRLENLYRSLRRMEEGSFEVQTPPRSADEIGRLQELAGRLSGQLSRDLKRIAAGLQEIADGNFERPIETMDASGELAEVARSINAMAAKLHRSILDERYAEQTKNDLITGVSHDLRTPLTSILGFLEVIHQDRYRDEVELRHYTDIAYNKALSLKKLIDDLFEYTRINNGMPLSAADLDLVGFVRQLAEEFVPQLEEAGMICRIDAEVETLPLSADGDLLVRSFGNLIANAIRYGRPAPYIDIAVRRSDEEAIVEIANYGNPIPERDLPFIFDRFYRVERSRSQETGGTGLGLAITKSIIEVHGGTIDVSSSPDKTVFTTRLPL
ncbi:sensor histidine kinase [Cohnella hongkongensis]|uniref:histidine kinase n=1 Tax=Cohnella hongkongensis TaxID=178337 RepID=A0ABV9F5J8_9BACL